MKKSNNPFYHNDLSFDEEKHLYIHKKTKTPLTSVSQVLHHFTHPFDPTGEITKKYAEKHGLPVEEVLKQWEKKKVDACTFGTATHLSLETYINTGQILDNDHKLIIENFRSVFKPEGQVFSEIRLYSLKYKVAGTSDLVILNDDNSVSIGDLKTNDAIKKFAFNRKMLPPLDCFSDANFYHYQMQLSTYGYLIELMYGLKIRDLALYHVNKKTAVVTKHPLWYCRNKARLMLEHFYAMENF